MIDNINKFDRVLDFCLKANTLPCPLVSLFGMNDYTTFIAYKLHDNHGWSYTPEFDIHDVDGLLKITFDNLEDEWGLISKNGGIASIFDLSTGNKLIGRYKLYNNLESLYVDGDIFDIEDLIVITDVGSGSKETSASGSGSGSSEFGIKLPSSYTGRHHIEFILKHNDVDNDGIDLSGIGWFNECTSLYGINLSSEVTNANLSTFKDSSLYKLIINSKYIYESKLIGNILKYISLSYVRSGSSITTLTSIIKDSYDSSRLNIGTLVIPSTIENISEGFNYGKVNNLIINKNYNDLTIPNYAFSYSSLANISLGEGIINIGDYAFLGNKFTSIVIPNTVETIGKYAFYSCTELKSVDINNMVETIGEYAFSECTKLNSVRIGWDITEIPNYAFNNDTSLANLVFDEDSKLTTIGILAFYESPIASLKLPRYLTKIGTNAFCGRELISLSINEYFPATSYSEFNEIFFRFDNLEYVVVDSGNRLIDSRYNCNAVINSSTNELILGSKNTIIPKDVTSISSGAFENLKITSINIPDSVTKIGTYAFADCTSLNSVTIGNGITSIGDNAFADCNSLTSIIIKATTPPTIGINLISSTTGVTIYVPDESVDDYKADTNWSTYADIIQAI